MAYSSLATHVKTNMAFKLMPDMDWSISELESLSPLEREAYLGLARDFIEKVNEKRRKASR